MQHAAIISIGTELALGQTVDTNTAWLAQQLAGIGIRTTRHATVADELADLVNVLQDAAERVDLVLVTGGLGPTADDLTREAVAAAAGTDLVEDATSLEQIRAFFTRRERQMPARNSVQAQRPRTGVCLENAWGTAPGLRVEIGATPVYCMPGVPREMRAMFSERVLPDLPRRTLIRSRRLQCFGLGESDLGDRIRDLMERGRNPEVGTTAAYALVGVRINATGETEQEVARLLDDCEQEVRTRLGAYVFGTGDDTLAGAVLAELGQRNATLATAESCTGGLVGELLTAVPGSSRSYLGGVVTYANEVKQNLLGVPERMLQEHGAVSEPVAAHMAEQVRVRLGASYGLSFSGIAGPGGGTADKPVGLVYIGVAGPDGCRAHRFQFGSDAERPVIRQRAAWTGLNLVRRLCMDG